MIEHDVVRTVFHGVCWPSSPSPWICTTPQIPACSLLQYFHIEPWYLSEPQSGQDGLWPPPPFSSAGFHSSLARPEFPMVVVYTKTFLILLPRLNKLLFLPCLWLYMCYDCKSLLLSCTFKWTLFFLSWSVSRNELFPFIQFSSNFTSSCIFFRNSISSIRDSIFRSSSKRARVASSTSCKYAQIWWHKTKAKHVSLIIQPQRLSIMWIIILNRITQHDIFIFFPQIN